MRKGAAKLGLSQRARRGAGGKKLGWHGKGASKGEAKRASNP